MDIIEISTAELFGNYIRDVIENDAADAAVSLARNMADIFEKYAAAESWRTFDRAEFLRVALADNGTPRI